MADRQPIQDRPLDLRGRLSIEADGQTFDLTAEGDRIVVDLHDLSVLKSLFRSGGDKQQLNALTSQLSRHDLEVVIQLKGQTIATLGREAEPGAIEKVFNLEGLDVRFRELAKAWLNRGS